jgi:hypothetical protein
VLLGWRCSNHSILYVYSAHSPDMTSRRGVAESRSGVSACICRHWCECVLLVLRVTFHPLAPSASTSNQAAMQRR